jgi:hypothetical protein
MICRLHRRSPQVTNRLNLPVFPETQYTEFQECIVRGERDHIVIFGVLWFFWYFFVVIYHVGYWSKFSEFSRLGAETSWVFIKCKKS